MEKDSNEMNDLNTKSLHKPQEKRLKSYNIEGSGKSAKKIVITKNNIIKSIIPTEVMIEQANKIKDIWFEKKTDKCSDEEVKEKTGIVTCTQDLIEEKEFHLVIHKNIDVDSNISLESVNPKSIIRKPKKGKKQKERSYDEMILEVRNLNEEQENEKRNESEPEKQTVTQEIRSDIKNVEDEFLKLMIPDTSNQKSTKNTENISIEQNNEKMELQNESTAAASNLMDISYFLAKNKKIQKICRRIQMWKEYESQSWLSDFQYECTHHTSSKPNRAQKSENGMKS